MDLKPWGCVRKVNSLDFSLTAITGIPLNSGYPFYASTVGHTYTSCAALCAADDRCRHFNLHKDTTTCSRYPSLRSTDLYVNFAYDSGVTVPSKIYQDKCADIATRADIYGVRPRCRAGVSSAFRDKYYAETPNHSYTSCTALCAEEDRCASFRFDRAAGICYRFSFLHYIQMEADHSVDSGEAVPPKVPRTRCLDISSRPDIYGLRPRCGVKFLDGVPYAQTPGHSFTSCAALCAADDQCKDFQTQTSTGTCYRYSTEETSDVVGDLDYDCGQGPDEKVPYKTCKDVGDNQTLAGLTTHCGFALKAVPYSWTTGDTFVECAEACQEDPECHNFGYQEAGRNCSRYYGGQGADLEENPLSDVGTSTKQKPLGKTCSQVGNNTAMGSFTAKCGFSLKGTAYNVTTTDNYPICLELCHTDIDCEHFSYRRQDGLCQRYYAGQGGVIEANPEFDAGISPNPKQSLKTCRDFSGSGELVQGFRVYCGVGFTASPYDSSAQESFLLCAIRCADDGSCVNFDYHEDTLTCRKFGAGASIEVRNNVDHAVGLGDGVVLPTTTTGPAPSTTAIMPSTTSAGPAPSETCGCWVTEYAPPEMCSMRWDCGSVNFY